MKTTERRLLGRQAAADYLDVTPRTIERLVRAGVLARVRLAGIRRTLFEKADLDKLVDERSAAAGHE